MSLFDTFETIILSVISETELKRLVSVKMEVSDYSGHHVDTYTFMKNAWPKIKEAKRFSDRSVVDEKLIDYFEEMEDEHFLFLRYGAKLSDFSDAEIVEEFNKRLNSPFHHVKIFNRVEVG